jgi:CRP/FNR family transcriptional regulator, anaerobic regulatory protein
MLLTKESVSSEIPGFIYGGSKASPGPCDDCAVRHLNFCSALSNGGAEWPASKWRYRVTPARHNIYRAGEPSEGVLVICEGWAVRFVQLPNGKRQILSVAMPGDLVSSSSLLEQELEFSIQAVTRVKYCTLPFAEVRARICDRPAVFDLWLQLTAAEHREADRRLVDLGQRPALERVAALIVHVMLRSEERRDVEDDAFAFPLSQQQIADCTGITPVHACRVLSAMRKDGICDVSRGAVHVIDRAELVRLGSVK